MVKNSRLESLFKLDGKVEIYVPSTKDVNKKVSNAKYVTKALELISECFGGATTTKAVGSWKSPCGLVREKVDLVYGYCSTQQLEESIDKIIDFIEWLKIEMSQESVAITINGEMYFV